MGTGEWVAVGVVIVGIVVGMMAWLINTLKELVTRFFDGMEGRIDTVAKDLTSALRELQVEISETRKIGIQNAQDIAVLQKVHNNVTGRADFNDDDRRRV